MAGDKNLIVRFGADLSPLEKSIVKASKSCEKFGREVATLGKSMSAAITLPLVGLGTAAVAASETIKGGMDKIRVGTGATGVVLEKLGASMRAVYGSVPVSAEVAGAAIAELNTRVGLSGKPLEEMASRMLNLSRITQTDVVPLVAETTRAFNSWGVASKDQGAALDTLFRVSQSTGIGVQALASNLSRGGATLRALGVPIGTAAALLGGFELSGLSCEKMLEGLKMALGKTAVAGKDLGPTVLSAFSAIKSASSDSAAAAVAVKTFGESGVQMAAAIRAGAFDVDSLAKALSGSGDTINKAAADTDGLAAAFGTLKNKVTLALEPLGTAMVKLFLDMMPLFNSCIAGLAGLVTAFSSLPAPVQTSLIVIAGIAAAVGPALVAIGGLIVGFAKVTASIIALKATGGAAWAAVAGVFAGSGATMAGAAAMVSGAFASVAGIVPVVIGAVGAFGTALLGVVSAPITGCIAALAILWMKWDGFREAVISIATAIPTAIKGLWERFRDLCTSLWSGITSTVSSAVNAIVDRAVGLASLLKDAAKAALGPYYDSIVSGMSTAWDFLVSAWEKIKGVLSSIGAWISKQISDVWEGFKITCGQIVDMAAKAANAIASLFSSSAATVSTATAAASTAAGAASGSSSGASSGLGASAFTNPFTSGSAASGSPGSTAAAAPASTWNQGGTQQFVNPYDTPATQGAERTYSAGSPTKTGPGWSEPTSTVLGVTQRPTWSTFGTGIFTSTAGQNGATSVFGVTQRPTWTSVTKMADGGIVTSPRLALIGESGPEAVIPLSGGRGGGSVTIHVHVSGSVSTQTDLAEQIRKSLIRSANRNYTTGIV